MKIKYFQFKNDKYKLVILPCGDKELYSHYKKSNEYKNTFKKEYSHYVNNSYENTFGENYSIQDIKNWIERTLI